MTRRADDDAERPGRLELPPEVARCVAAVATPSTPAYAVGGAVRDAMLGLAVDDYDFATAARPERLRQALGELGPIDVIEELGRVAVVAGGHDVVFTTFRVEAGYGEDRRPARVRFTDRIADDAQRRDFTVNAIYVDAQRGDVVDPVGGTEDLAACRLRVIGDPRARFREDPLRILRAVRFEASRRLTPTPATAAAMAEFAPRCARLTAGRRFEELDRALGEPRAAAAVERLLDLGALGHVVPALADQVPRVRAETLRMLERVGAGDRVGGWSALLGDPPTAERALRELHAPRRLQRAVAAHVSLVPLLSAGRELTPGAWRRQVRQAPGAAVGFAAALAEVRGDAAGAGRLRDARERSAAGPAVPDGREVVALGVPPGPEVGRILAALRERVDRGELADPAAVRSALEAEVRRRVKGPGREGR